MIDENIEDAALMVSVSDIIRHRYLSQITTPRLIPLVEAGVTVCHNVLEKIFETQGVGLSLYALDQDDDVSVEIDARAIIIEEVGSVPEFAANKPRWPIGWLPCSGK